ncbi:MAG: hypothetical protein ACXVMS_12885 [Flavisolibacter sp.]
MKKLCFLFLIAFGLSARGQSVAGYWYGTATVENGGGNNYLVELILKQNSTAVQAVMNYYFRNTFRSIKLNGNYNSMTRELSLFNVPVPYAGSGNNMEVDCITDFRALHRMAKTGSNLNGKFYARDAYKYTCGNIVFDLKLNKDASNQDSILTALKNFKETYQVWTPTATDTLVAATVQQRPIENIVVKNEYKQRAVEVQKEILVDGDSLQVDFYDNGEVDGDSISVFYNDQLLGANLRLSTKSIHMNIGLDSTREANTLSMFANNLGSIPPNTALMLIYDGKKRYEVRLSSNLEKSAAVRIRRKPPTPPTGKK